MSAALEVRVPDIGDFKDIPVIEVLVHPGDSINPEDPLVTLESDKATMEVPSPAGGTVKELKVKVGDKVSKGTLVLLLESAAEEKSTTAPASAPAASTPSTEAAPAPASTAPAPTESAPTESAPTESAPTESAPTEPAVNRSDPAPAATRSPPLAAPAAAVDEVTFAAAHASPVVRRFARELGVELGKVQGSGPRGRILKEDVQAFVKQELGSPRVAAGAGLNLLPWPQVDFAKFGAIESVALSRIRKLSGANLARNWAMIPHVTQHDEADISALEDFRKAQAKAVEKQGVRLTLLAFLMKACVVALKEFPQFNASLATDGESLILKKYFHIGVAVDTPDGLVVPVIRNVDGKGVLELAKELAEVSANARARKLTPGSMQGGSFSISSLGGIGGTAFTPIINAPEVAILGIAKSVTRPVYVNGELAPRVILPLSLSYDHRVIDGAQGARFTAFLVALLGDIRRLVL
jgi:pyruvate dehydrogenase E2 component (dihydrolipoamide acetyltransferase)